MCWVLLVLASGYSPVLCQGLRGAYCNPRCPKPILLIIFWHATVLNKYLSFATMKLVSRSHFKMDWNVTSYGFITTLGQLGGPASPPPLSISFVGLCEFLTLISVDMIALSVVSWCPLSDPFSKTICSTVSVFPVLLQGHAFNHWVLLALKIPQIKNHLKIVLVSIYGGKVDLTISVFHTRQLKLAWAKEWGFQSRLASRVSWYSNFHTASQPSQCSCKDQMRQAMLESA